MKWQEHISIKLNLRESTNKIIIDNTGLLVTKEFIAYVKSQQLNIKKSDDISEIVKLVNSIRGINVVTTLHHSYIPSHLNAHAEVHKFSFSDLPFKLPIQFFERLSIEELITTLEYIANTNFDFNNFNDYAIKDLLTKSNTYKLTAEYKNTIKSIEKLLVQECDYNIILEIGYHLGKLVYLGWLSNQIISDELIQQIDNFVSSYIYAGKLKNIYYEPIANFRSVDKIRDYVNQQNEKKIALICFDGMGVAEWLLLKEYLRPLNINFRERFVFSLIPSNTIISRSAIFYGDLNIVYHLKSSNEEKAFKEFFPSSHTKFFSNFNKAKKNDLLGYDVIAGISNIFDSIGHNTKLPINVKTKNIYFENVENYLQKSSIVNLIDNLVKEKYKIYICSDHGCVVAKGNGEKIDKWMQDQHCKRACLLENNELAINLKTINNEFYELPFEKSKIALLAKNRTMFDSMKKNGITHGGITVEEIVVPFIEVYE